MTYSYNTKKYQKTLLNRKECTGFKTETRELIAYFFLAFTDNVKYFISSNANVGITKMSVDFAYELYVCVEMNV